MDRRFRRFRMVLVTGLVMLSLAAFTGSVSAAPGPTSDGFTGACNMLQAWGVGAHGGMQHAMFGTPAYERMGDEHKGNLGMWRAVDVSGCS